MTYIKIGGKWHVKESDGKIGVKDAAVLLCNGLPVVDLGYPKSEDEKGDDAPLCAHCQKPLPDAVKARLRKANNF